MTANLSRRLTALLIAAVLLLPACASAGTPEAGALTWTTWSGYEEFLKLLEGTYPDIALEYLPYSGGNRTGYSWIQMRNDDIADIFITSQILDETKMSAISS